MITIAVLLTSFCTMTWDDAKVDSTLEERWRREYPIAAAEWEAAAQGFSAQGRMSFHWLDGSTTTVKALKVAASGDKRLFVWEGKTFARPGAPPPAEVSEAECETEEYMFNLRKNATSSHYIIEGYGPYEEVEDSRFQLWFKRFARNATSYLGTSFLQRMQDPSFVLKSIEAVERGDGEIVRIGYDYENKYVFESGVVDLDVGKNWAIRRVETNARNKKDAPSAVLKVDVEYEKLDHAKFFPRRMESFLRIAQKDMYEHMIVEYDEVRLGPPPDEAFKLPAFGLPDVPLRPLPRASIFTFANPLLWLTLAASVASFILLWHLRPRKPSPA